MRDKSKINNWREYVNIVQPIINKHIEEIKKETNSLIGIGTDDNNGEYVFDGLLDLHYIIEEMIEILREETDNQILEDVNSGVTKEDAINRIKHLEKLLNNAIKINEFSEQKLERIKKFINKECEFYKNNQTKDKICENCSNANCLLKDILKITESEEE